MKYHYCEFCDRKFVWRLSLHLHLKYSKKCMKIAISEEISCNPCYHVPCEKFENPTYVGYASEPEEERCVPQNNPIMIRKKYESLFGGI
jgi:hypothetical protein